MSFIVLGHFDYEGPDDLLFITADRALAEQVVASLKRHHRLTKYHKWGYGPVDECGCFSAAEVPDVMPGQTAITYEGQEVRLDYWTPPRLDGAILAR